jgi:iron complex outermembrane receptor protein
VLCPNPPASNGGNYINQCNVPLVSVTAANPGLKPEKSTSKTLGIILEPTKWISMTADYYDIKIDNMIISGNQDPLLFAAAQPVRGTPVPEPYRTSGGTLVTQTPPVGDIGYFSIPYINLGYLETKGFEFDITNHFDLGELGKIRTDLDWTLISDYVLSMPAYPQLGVPALGAYQLVGTHGPNEISADTGTPRNRGRFNMTWDRGPVEVSATVNYVSGFGVTDPSWSTNPFGVDLSTCSGMFEWATEYHGSGFFPSGNAPTNLCHIPSFTDVDLYASYTFDKHWKIHGSVGNVFDRQAPQDAQTYASPNLNTAYHLDGAVGRSFLVGAAYTF